jgi:hypothetical protein
LFQTGVDLVIRCAASGRDTASKKNWTAGAWLLERRWPHKWATDKKELRELTKMLQELQKKTEGMK